MRKAAVALMLLVLLLILPGSSAQFVSFTTNDEITLLRGDYSTGRITLTNSGGLSFRVVSYQRFWVEDSEGNEVPGFNLSLTPTIFSDWSPQKSYSITYNISCVSNVSGGTYTLYLRFMAYTSDNSLYIVHAEVPLHIIESPLKFDVAEAYVKERPASSYVLNGETIVVFSHVQNIGHSSVPVTASVTFSLRGKTYYSSRKEVKMAPGDNVIKFEVPVKYEFPEGTYRLEYLIKYNGDSYRYSKEFPVRFGVKLVGLSLQSDSVKVNERNRAYLTLLSERTITLNLTVETRLNGTLVSASAEPVALTGGTNVLEVDLPTNVSGLLTSRIRLSYGDRVIGEGNVSYKVVAPPGISEVTYERISTDTVVFRVLVSNPNSENIEGTLTYRILSNGSVLYKDIVEKTFEPGMNEVSMEFKLPVGEVVEYEFTLTSLGEASTSKGELYLQPPAPPTTTTTTTTTITNTTTTTTPAGGGSGLWVLILVLLLLLIVVGGLYYVQSQKKPRKRSRPKPKRRSPLGRFRRPKKPEFKEGKELPKK